MKERIYLQTFAVGKKAPEYSYNWPYDFCSLVEKVNVEGVIEFMPPAEDVSVDPTLRRIDDPESALVAAQTSTSVVARTSAPTATVSTSRPGKIFGDDS